MIVGSGYAPAQILAVPELFGAPFWVPLTVLPPAVAAVVLALTGKAPAPGASSPRQDRWVINEVHKVDRILNAHGYWMLALIAIAAGAFVTLYNTKNGPGSGLTFASVTALMTAGGLSAAGFALEGGPTVLPTLSEDERRHCINRNVRRLYRRTRLLRVSSWCLFPTILLILISAVAVFQ